MKSMTGYGKGEAESAGRKVVIELKSVNNRYLEVNSRLSKSFSFADDAVKKCIQEKIKRGTVEVFYSYSIAGVCDKQVDIDEALAEKYVAAAAALANKFGILNDYSVSSLIKMPDIISVTSASDNQDEIAALFVAAAKKAAIELDKMRVVEGKSIREDLTRLADNISSALEAVKQRAPAVVTEYKDKLKTRISELCAGVAVDEARFVSEVAFFADRCDVNEEISRLSSHISQFLSALSGDDAAGRRLDFLSQEMNREINTIGSKANDLALTNIVIGMKNELEKIKEQIRNVE